MSAQTLANRLLRLERMGASRRTVIRIQGGLDADALREFHRQRIVREALGMGLAAMDEMARVDPASIPGPA
jgi:hypothetical protein